MAVRSESVLDGQLAFNNIFNSLEATLNKFGLA